jgi:hypothetical protein
VPVAQRAAAGREHDPLGALGLRLLRPAAPLHQLYVRGPQRQQPEAGEQRRLHHLHARCQGGHR